MKKRVEPKKEEIKHEHKGGWVQERRKQTCMVRKLGLRENKVNTNMRKVRIRKSENEHEHQEKVNCELTRIKLSSPHLHTIR